jgi:diguanylate cyclase (GGDEF)-like protein
MFKRLIDTFRSERSLPLEIRLQLVDGLFYPFASLIVGAVVGLWIAATVTLMVHDVLVEAVADFIVVAAIVRIVIGFRYVSRGKPADRTDVAFWEAAYGIGAALFSTALGVLCLLAIMRVDNAPLHLMLTTTTGGYAASIAGRNAGRPWIAISQLLLAAGPMCLGLVLGGTTFYHVMGYALFLFMFGMTDITLSVRKTIVGALETKIANAELARSFKSQANLFDAALNNMSHGLCMFDSDGKLLVWNHKLAGILGCKDAIFEKDLPIDELLDRLKASVPRESAKPLTEALRHGFNARTARQTLVKLGSEKVAAVSRQKMENGNVVIVFEDVTEQTKANMRINQLAWTDELTGLMNRASFREVLAKTIKLLEPGAAAALHLIDLDHFKSVNDTLGHPVGDRLLVEVAKRITLACGDEGQVARLGGDEFVIIQRPILGSITVEALANRVIATLCEPFEIDANRINIGASVGIAQMPQQGDSVDVLLKRADMALYKAKAEGRSCFRFFDDTLDLYVQHRRLLELDIRTAMEQRQFTLAFQPIVQMPSGEIASFETLIRWHHPTRGYVSPAEFIPVAEETGLIMEIGRWVLEEACRHASTWPTEASIAVNFSAMQFQDKGFPLFLVATLNKFGFPASRLELEITETALLEDRGPTIAMLEQFRSLGIRVSLDDFGTGYSSLSQLRTFAFSKIKIDGSFVRDIERSASSIAVIRAVANLGKILGMSVVAECVESEDQLKFLVAAGCDQIQGYLLGRPLGPEAMDHLFASYSTEQTRNYLTAS